MNPFKYMNPFTIAKEKAIAKAIAKEKAIAISISKRKKLYNEHINIIENTPDPSIIPNKIDGSEIMFSILDNNIDWYSLSYGNITKDTRDSASIFLLSNPDKIRWDIVSYNDNDMVVQYLIDNPDKIVWYDFSINSNNLAVKYCIENSDRIV